MTGNETTTRTRARSRRDVLALAGSAVAVGLAGCLTGDSTAKHGWQRVSSPTGNALHAVDRREGRGATVGPGGTVVTVDDNEWSTADTPVSKTLHGVALGTVEFADVAVGADGTILENFQ